MKTDEEFMLIALEQAKLAEQIGEIPVGAVVVHEREIIGCGFNQSISQHDPSAHAEVIALRNAAKYVENYRLVDCTLYVTLEPCPMCASLLVHSRVKRVVFGAYDAKTGACGSVMNLVEHESMNHVYSVEGGVLQEQCSSVISEFFKKRRQQKKQEKQNKQRSEK